jgi:glycine C-acetyltransferase
MPWASWASTGRGTHEHHRVMGRVDVLTGTLGKALGGASGGYTSGRKEIIELLRQRSRPYLFSNTLAPAIAGASLKVLDLLSASTELRTSWKLTRSSSVKAWPGLASLSCPATHPIVPVMLGEAALAARFADAMLQKGVYVIGFSYPVVPQGKARIRTQISAAHSREDLAFAIEQFAAVKKELGL